MKDVECNVHTFAAWIRVHIPLKFTELAYFLQALFTISWGTAAEHREFGSHDDA